MFQKLTLSDYYYCRFLETVNLKTRPRIKDVAPHIPERPDPGDELGLPFTGGRRVPRLRRSVCLANALAGLERDARGLALPPLCVVIPVQSSVQSAPAPIDKPKS